MFHSYRFTPIAWQRESERAFIRVWLHMYLCNVHVVCTQNAKTSHIRGQRNNLTIKSFAILSNFALIRTIGGEQCAAQWILYFIIKYSVCSFRRGYTQQCVCRAFARMRNTKPLSIVFVATTILGPHSLVSLSAAAAAALLSARCRFYYCALRVKFKLVYRLTENQSKYIKRKSY